MNVGAVLWNRANHFFGGKVPNEAIRTVWRAKIGTRMPLMVEEMLLLVVLTGMVLAMS